MPETGFEIVPSYLYIHSVALGKLTSLQSRVTLTGELSTK